MAPISLFTSTVFVQKLKMYITFLKSIDFYEKKDFSILFSYSLKLTNDSKCVRSPTFYCGMSFLIRMLTFVVSYFDDK